MRAVWISTLWVLLCYVGVECSASAQLKSTYGMKLVLNYSNYTVSDANNVSMKRGVAVGGYLRLQSPKHSWWFLQADAMLTHKRSSASIHSIDRGDFRIDYKYTGIAVPLYYCLQADLGGMERLSFGAGPYLAYNFAFDVKERDPDVNTNLENYAIRRMDTGVACIFAFDCGKHWQINAGLRMGLRDLSISSERKMYNTVSYIGMGYTF